MLAKVLSLVFLAVPVFCLELPVPDDTSSRQLSETPSGDYVPTTHEVLWERYASSECSDPPAFSTTLNGTCAVNVEVATLYYLPWTIQFIACVSPTMAFIQLCATTSNGGYFRAGSDVCGLEL